MKNWTLDQLKAQLANRAEVKGWMIIQEHVHRRERYFMKDGGTLAVDQDRETRAEDTYLNVFVRGSKPGRQGETQKKMLRARPIAEQLDAAIEAAKQTDHQRWDLPTEIPSDIPRRATADPRMAEDLEGVMGELTDRIHRSVGTKRETDFNSSELFLSLLDRETHLSNGLVHRTSQSRVYVEAAFSMTKPGADGKPRSDEYMTTAWSVSLDDLPVAKLFDETSAHAQVSLDTVKPETGTYSVIVDSEVLATLLNGHLGQLSAANRYHQLPYGKPGDELIPGATGDLLTLTLDPALPYGADTSAISGEGLLQVPLKLVEKNRVLASTTDKRHADWLNLPPSTVRGNLVVEPGKLSFKDLTASAPKVIEILQFSGLFAEPNSGTFSSEIRLARLYDNVTGKVTYLKGGSLSGSILENFRNAKLSSNRVKRAHFSSESRHGQGYFGPEHALLSDVSIVG